ENILLPADIPAPRQGGDLLVRRFGVPVNDVLDQIQRRGARLSLLILDACRDNPFPRQGTRSLGGTRGLARMEAPEGAYIMYSAGAGQAALDRLSDDDPDPNSVFTRALLPRLTTPGMRLRDMVLEVRSEVRQLAMSVGHDQFPAVYDQLDGEFLFIPAALTPDPQLPGAQASCAAAQSVWAALQNSEDETALTAFATGYAATCPTLADRAREQLAALQDRELLANCESLAGEDSVSWEALRGGNTRAAAEACRAAVEVFPDDPDALHALGRALQAAGDHAEALRWHRRAAEAGNSRSMHQIGVFHQHGLGVAQDYAEALRWYRRGAEAGHLMSMSNIGYLHYNGQGVRRDDREAARWFMQSLHGAPGRVEWVREHAPTWRRDTLREVQRILQEAGVYDGALDGVFGPRTRAALEAYANLD
ncbi:MAG: SEL1-like repeat protein, partial [Ectothiorhodospiraceae bacterium]|nr:SEL1-like repeat protein [Ectothiorhodospiraceae bacterium]